jgi:hypothetical protein
MAQTLHQSHDLSAVVLSIAHPTSGKPIFIRLEAGDLLAIDFAISQISFELPRLREQLSYPPHEVQVIDGGEAKIIAISGRAGLTKTIVTGQPATVIPIVVRPSQTQTAIEGQPRPVTVIQGRGR